MANNITNPVNNINSASEGTLRTSANETLAETNGITRAQDSLGSIRAQVGSDQSRGAASRVDRAFVSKSSVGIGASRPSVNSSGPAGNNYTEASPQPIISILGEERIGPGFTFNNADGSVTKTSINAQGLYQELTTYTDKSSTTAVYQDLPKDANGSPTGYRVTYTDKNSSGRVVNTDTASLIISDLGNGKSTANFVYLTDPNNPVNIYSSILSDSGAKDDDGHPIYNSQTKFADGSTSSKTYTQIPPSTGFDVEMKTGYLQTITDHYTDGSSKVTVLSTISKTDAQGNRVTTISDITDPNHAVLVSQSSKPDPFIKGARNFGTDMSKYLDYLSQAGALDINGDGKNDPMTDLILISRYSRGLRGNDLTANLNLGANPPPTASMEAKLADAFSRGLYDINGNKATDSSKRATLIDINFIARYMFGARDNALTDSREANDDSISIAANGSNVVALADTDPLLNDFRQIFNLDGVGIKTSTQSLKVFYVNLEQTGPTGYNANTGNIIRGNNSTGGDLHYIRNGGYAAPLNEVSSFANSNRAITRLGDLTSSTFSGGTVTPEDYGLA